ncbi:anthranilate synthase component I [Candidatus Omnitrophota bacterium]
MDISSLHPTIGRNDFLKLARRYNVIPVSFDLGEDFISPIQLYAKIKTKRYSFLLESVEGQEKISRFSFVGFVPLCVVTSKGAQVEIKDMISGTSDRVKTKTDPLDELKRAMKRFKVYVEKGSRFSGGFVGYLGYDNVRFFEPVLDRAGRAKRAESSFAFCKYLCVFDHKEKRIRMTTFVPLGSTSAKGSLTRLYNFELKKLAALIGGLARNIKLTPVALTKKRKALKFRSNFSKKDFMAKVRQAKEYIRRGEIIQVVLSQRLEASYTKDPFDIYRYLRILNPSAYMYYLNFGTLKIIGASPEMLLRCENKVLITRPIAGTRPRGKTEERDLALERDLLADPKEKAEHIMLVDLGRNDLGRTSHKGMVKVPIFMKIERFSHVMHIVSEVRAKLDKGKDTFAALKSCFPAGTVSGAPKIRAMEIIDEFEPQSRGAYAGCVGYFSFTGNLDTAIIIRTIILKGRRAYVQAGAGIVLDSKPEKEYFETLNKAKAQLLALELAQ